jgi:hypothetical protein
MIMRRMKQMGCEKLAGVTYFRERQVMVGCLERRRGRIGERQKTIQQGSY